MQRRKGLITDGLSNRQTDPLREIPKHISLERTVTLFEPFFGMETPQGRMNLTSLSR